MPCGTAPLLVPVHGSVMVETAGRTPAAVNGGTGALLPGTHGTYGNSGSGVLCRNFAGQGCYRETI
jgi:hypothetical protein